jgi:hypothetical protein
MIGSVSLIKLTPLRKKKRSVLGGPGHCLGKCGALEPAPDHLQSFNRHLDVVIRDYDMEMRRSMIVGVDVN